MHPTNIIFENRWLEELTRELSELWNLCDHDEERWLIEELLNRMSYLTSNDLKKYAKKIKAHIINNWGATSNSTFITAISDNNTSDGSQNVIQGLKNSFAGELGWEEKNFLNSIAHIQGLGNNSIIILFDDFVGTGNTANKKIKWAHNKLNSLKKEKCKLYFIAIAGMKEGINTINKYVEGVYIPLQMEKGISNFYFTTELKEKAISAMENLEKKLGKKYKKKKLEDFYFGYGRSEALYTAEFCSTPNNVFPIFWWAESKDGKARKTLFKRL